MDFESFVGSFNWCTQVPTIRCCLLHSFHLHSRFTLLTVGHSSSFSLYFYYIHSRSFTVNLVIICLLNYHSCTRKVDRQDKQNKMMVVGRSTILLGLCLLLLTPIGATQSRQPQYGLESIDGYCEGWGELDQLADIASQALNAKYPYMGPMRVS